MPQPLFFLHLARVLLIGAAIVSVLVAWRRRRRAIPTGRTETLDDSTFATNPGGIPLSQRRLEALQPELGSDTLWSKYRAQYVTCSCTEHHERQWWLKHLTEKLGFGDARAAVVVSVSPLLVAAYSDELDAVALLHFDERLVSEYRLRVGSRLVSVNTYGKDPRGRYQEDLLPGPNHNARWHRFDPMIADFLTESRPSLEATRASISDEEWQYAMKLGSEALARTKGLSARDGRPLFMGRPRSWVAPAARS